jgi:chaperone BCS1
MLEWIHDFAAQNQFFSGLAGASVVGGAVYWCRALPTQVWDWTKWACSYRVEISNDSDVFPTVLSWVTHEAAGRWHNRHFKLLEEGRNSGGGVPYDEDGEKDHAWLLSPGMGTHWLSFEGRPVSAEREVTNEQHASHSHVREVLRLRLYSRDRERLHRMIDSFRLVRDQRATTAIYLWRKDYWRLTDRRKPRPLESVVLPTGIMSDLAIDMRRFLDNEAWYAERGVPYRRGYLFAGEPGTGKSSAALALAGHLGMPIYVLNFGSIGSDDALIDAITSVSPRSMLLIEDIDTDHISRDRNTAPTNPGDTLTLGALLNALDGAMARDGRLLVVTANHPELVDRAVLREGRIDRRVEFKLSAASEAAALFERFFPEAPELADGLRVNGFDPRSAAAIQAILVANADHPHKAFTQLRQGPPQ